MPENFVEIINTEGETSRFSVDRVARDLATLGHSREMAVAVARDLHDDLRRADLPATGSDGQPRATTDAVRHWLVERDISVLERPRRLEVSIAAEPLEIRNYAEARGGLARIDAYSAEKGEIIAPPPAMAAAPKPPALVVEGDAIYLDWGTDKEDLSEIVKDAVSNRILANTWVAEMAMLGMAEIYPITFNPGVFFSPGTPTGLTAAAGPKTAEQLQKEIAQKRLAISAAQDKETKLYAKIVGAAGVGGFIEFFKKKFGDKAEDLLADHAKKMGFASATQAAKKMGKKALLKSFLRYLASKAHWITLILEMAIIGALLKQWLDVSNKLDGLEVELHNELTQLGNLKSAGRIYDVGGGVPAHIKKPCKATVTVMTRYLVVDGPNKGSFQTDVLAGPTPIKLDPGGGGVHTEKVAIPKRGKYQFLIARVTIKCPGQEERRFDVVHEAVKHD